QAADAKQQQAEQERLAKAEAEVKRGLAYADKKDYDRAIEAYDAALRIFPGYSQAVTNRQTAVNAKQQQAKQEAAAALLAIGNRYLNEKNYDQAIAQYDAALQIVPDYSQAITNRQQAADAKQKQAEQERLAKAEAEVKRGLAYADKKDYDRAIAAYDAALRIFPDYSQAVTNRQTAINAKAEAEALLVNGNRYFNEKNYDQAIAQYDAALEIVPGFPQAVTNRQQAADAKQKQAEQERLAKAEAEVKRGLAYADKKDYDRAIAAYDAALRIFPDYSQAVTNRQNAVNAKAEAEALLVNGNKYFNEKNYDQAIAQYDAALRIFPGLPQAITNRQQAADAKQKQAEQERLAEAEVKRGLAYADKKDYDRAIAAYDAALRIVPDYSQAVRNRQNAVSAKAEAEAEALLVNGNRYLTEKNYDQAIAQYDAALRIFPGLSQAVTNRQQAADAKQKQAEQERLAEAEVKRGLAYADKKDYDRAIAAYDAALRIFPDYSEAVRNRQNAENAKYDALFARGNAYFDAKEYDQAIAQYDAALRIFPGYSQALDKRQRAENAKQRK
ncbi:tetratricopeptide repeat protein, partial [Breznakiellaceae bacterium SP9]